MFKFPKTDVANTYSPKIGKIDAIKAFRTATQQGLHASKLSYDASFEGSPESIELKTLAEWVRAWFVAYYVTPSANPCSEATLQRTTQCTLEEPSVAKYQYFFEKFCTACQKVYYCARIDRDVYENALDNPSIEARYDLPDFYVRLTSSCMEPGCAG